MDRSLSVPNTNDEILAQFLTEYEAEPDKGAVLHRWGERYPYLADELRALTAMRERVENARPELYPDQPSQLGEFKIIREIGRGGMGVLYEAEQASLNNRRVAVKVIRKGRISPDMRARFLREQEVLAQLHQTHIVSIHSAGEQEGLQYFAMPYIQGAALHRVVDTALKLKTAQSGSKTPSLAELVGMVPANGSAAPRPDAKAATQNVSNRRQGENGTTTSETRSHGAPTVRLALSLPYFRSVAQVMADAAEALQHAHDAQIVHRDMKPSNLMVDKAGQCWIIDFGLARYLSVARENNAPAPAPLPDSTAISASGINGTPHYMAPEQWVKGKLDARTDIWGLGVTLYELLTLRRAFEPPTHDGKPATNEEIRQMILTQEQVPASRLVGNLPSDLAAICGKAMRKEPENRYASAKEFADDLRRWLRCEPIVARRAWPLRRAWLWARRNKGWAAASSIVFIAALCVAGILGVYEERRQEGQRQSLMRQMQWERQKKNMGWSTDSWAWVRKAAGIRKDDDLRNQAAASLVGLDARIFQEFTTFDASNVLFDHSGKRLLIGGASKWGKSGQPNARPAAPARICDLTTAESVLSEQTGPGPVAFRADGTPLQLVVNPKKSLDTLALGYRPAAARA